MEAASDPLEGSVRQKAAKVSPVGQRAPLCWAHCWVLMDIEGPSVPPLLLPLNTSGSIQFLPISMPAPCDAFPEHPPTHPPNYVVAK